MKGIRINQKNITIIATIGLLVLLYVTGILSYKNFSKPQVFLNIFVDNAFLIAVATGLAFVMISGGIDLSVSSVVAFTTMALSSMLKSGVNAYFAMAIVLAGGILFGLLQGFIIVRFDIHSWIVTLAGMFLARGSCYLISIQSIPIDNEVFVELSKYKIYLFEKNFISIGVVVSLVMVAAAIVVSRYTKFGRSLYAIGGNKKSATLMGLPVKRNNIIAYAISSFCAVLGGIIFSLYMLSGYALHCDGLEMDAIACCVIGGILLTGGVGNLIGPLLGVLSMGIIQTIIMFQGTLSSWWTKIVIGILLTLFIVLQRFIVIQREKRGQVKAIDQDSKLKISNSA